MTAGLQRTQRGRSLWIGRWRLETGNAQAVRYERAGAPRGGKDCHALPAQLAAGRERRRDVEQVPERLCTNNAELLEQCVVHPVRSRERTRVRYRGFRPCFRSPDLEGDDRFAGAPGPECRRPEFCGIAHRLDVKGDNAGGFVVSKVIDKVGQFEVDFVAGRHKLRKPDAARGRARQQCAKNSAALRDDADRPCGKVVHLQRAGR